MNIGFTGTQEGLHRRSDRPSIEHAIRYVGLELGGADPKTLELFRRTLRFQALQALDKP
jgi:hypothetical protein